MPSAWAFASAAKAQKSRRVQPDDDDPQLNIMSDPRVMRGSTYSLYRAPAQVAPEPRRPRRRKPPPSIFDQTLPPEPREELDISMNLVERPLIPDVKCEPTQTGPLLELPPPLPYVPVRVGVDAGTNMDGDLFDYDADVKPLLDVLVAKTLEQAQVEVEREDELAAIARDLKTKTKVRDARLREVADLEQDERARLREKQDVLQDNYAKLDARVCLNRKIAAAQIMDIVLPDIFDDIFDHFDARGTWVSPTVYDIRSVVLPHVYKQVDANLQRRAVADQLVDDLIATVTTTN